MPKGERCFRDAFAAVQQSGKASTEAIQVEFLKIYTTGQSRGGDAIVSRKKAFRRIAGSLPGDFKTEIGPDGSETIVQSDNPLDLFEAQAEG